MSRASIFVDPISQLIIFNLFFPLLLGISLPDKLYSLLSFFNRDREIVQSY